MITIYHNPRCRKSRETLKLIENAGYTPEIIEYLKTPPSKSELAALLKKMSLKPEAVVRKNEKVYKENFKGKVYSDTEWLNILVENPVLIERPIVVHNNRVTLGRPPENVLEIL